MVIFRKISLGVLLLFTISTLHAQSKKSRTVLDTEARRFEAMTRADTAALRPMLAEELVYVHSNAMKETKPEHLAAIASRKLVYEKMERQEAAIRFYGKTAIVNGKLKVGGLLNGNAFELPLLYTSVYQKQRGLWRMVSWQSTRIP